MDLYALPYEHALGDGGPRPFTKIVCIHATDNTASAAAEAGYATHRTDRTSAHFYVDDDEAYRALALDDIAFGCLYHGNRYSVQLELCGLSNQLTDATMRRAAPIVAEVCRLYGIPVEKIDASRARAAYFDGGPGGICGHADITAAFPEDNGDHTDPGASFPWSTFIGYVQAALDPAPPVQEDDMPLRDRFTVEPGVGVVTPVTLMAPVGSSYACKKVTLSFCNPINRPNYKLRLYWSSGNPQGAVAQIPAPPDSDTVTIKSGAEKQWPLDNTVRGIRVERVPVDASDLCDYPLSGVVVYE